jgi:hypothetical protein
MRVAGVCFAVATVELAGGALPLPAAVPRSTPGLPGGPYAARTGSLLVSPGPTLPAALYISPVNYTHTLIGPAGGPAASFYAAQWSNPAALTNASTEPGPAPGRCSPLPGQTVAWRVDNGAMRICALTAPDGSVTFELGEDGSGGRVPGAPGASPPHPAVDCGREFDAFLAPTDAAYVGVPMNVRSPAAGAPSLGALVELTISFSARLLEWGTAARCGRAGSCGPSGQVDYAYAVLGIVLGNPAPSGGGAPQTIFYQTILADTRRATPACAANDPCGSNFSNWYFDSLPTLGVSDSTSFLGLPCLQPGAATPTQYDVAFLPRLSAVIAHAAAAYGADGDAGRWWVNGLYVGTGLEGSAVAGVQVGGVDATYVLGVAGSAG